MQQFKPNKLPNNRPGKYNLVTNFMSKLVHLGDSAPVTHDFSDENLFSFSTYTPWYADVTNYLVTGKLPQNLSSREKQRIIQLSANYMWHEDCLYQTGPDLVIRRCVREYEMKDIIKYFHNE